MADGFLNILKPPGMSSHDVVGYVRRLFKMKKVGHAGTLDPAAAGVLPVALGKATRLIEYMAEADKSYRAEITFGIKTDSGDDTGEIIERLETFALPDAPKIQAVLSSFLGKSEQMPPMYSAIKINGQKLYELARQGIFVERKKRQIEITKIELLKADENKILFDTDCSKGTYIRSLCMDIGDRLAIPSTMSFLIRTRVGEFKLPDTVTLEELAEKKEAALLPSDTVISHLKPLYLDEMESLAFQQGKKLRCILDDIENVQKVRIYDKAKVFIGIGEADGKRLVPSKVFVR
jgi:tRNA pseudouridine55 synthase